MSARVESGSMVQRRRLVTTPDRSRTSGGPTGFIDAHVDSRQKLLEAEDKRQLERMELEKKMELERQKYEDEQDMCTRGMTMRNESEREESTRSSEQLKGPGLIRTCVKLTVSSTQDYHCDPFLAYPAYFRGDQTSL